MATKAERYRYQQERSGPGTARRPPKPRRDFPVDTSLPGVSATDRRAGAGSTAMRNLSPKRAANRAVYALEDSSSGKPSRRSTRKSANRSKPSHALGQAKVQKRMRIGRAIR